MSTLYLYEYDNVYLQFDSDDRGMLENFSEYFSFEIPNARFNPKVKAKVWDGKIRLANTLTMRIYRGLLPYIIDWCHQANVSLELDPDLKIEKIEINIFDFINSLNIPNITPHDYQYKAVEYCIKRKRATMVSPTSSGKSLIIYCLVRWLLNQNKKILITVPTISLVSQLYSDFEDYGWKDVENNVYKIYGGQDKDSKKHNVYISTWQSIFEQHKKYFEQFDCIIVDEAHGCSAESLKGILQYAKNADYRIGLTGTLQDTKCHSLVIEGLLGKRVKVTTTKKLTDRGIVSKLDIKCIHLKYPDGIRSDNKKLSYQEEMDFIRNYSKRNTIIKKLINITEDNSLILTAYRNHLKEIAEAIEKNTDKIVYTVHGEIDADEREKIRKLTESQNNVVIVATYGVFSTGVNIKNIQNVMFASSSKSQIRVLQSIGRGLRKDDKENKVVLFDIVDDFSYKKRKNYLLKHFFERIKIYEREKFDYKIKVIQL